VARRIDTEPIALLLATNDTRRVPAGLATITVTGLDRVANDTLLIERAAVEPAVPVRALLWEMTGGKPLARWETARALSDDQLAGREPIDRDLVPGAALQHALLARVEELPDATRTMLLVVATEGTGDLALAVKAGAALGVDADALEPAEVADFVRVDER